MEQKLNVLLPKDTLAQKLNRDNLESYNKIIEQDVKSMYESNTKEDFIIQDGPPYSNGDLHIGHLLNKTLKDFFIKYNLKKGFKVKIRFGWDCHGLPIENRAKNMDGDLLTNCESIARKYKEKQKSIINKFGIYSTEKDYLTLDEDFKSRELEIFKKLKNNGYIFNKNKPVWYSPTLKTVLANSEIEYKDIQDDSIYFKLPTNNNHSLLIWTTTEWTIPGNQAVCLNPELQYCTIFDGIICSENFALENEYDYELFNDKLTEYTNTLGKVCPVIYDEFVSNTQTGIVHLCGGHGDVDFDILSKHGIEPKNVVDNLDELLNHIETYKLDEKYLYSRLSLNHSYPVDWRNKDKVYKVLTEQTYLDFDWVKIKSVVKQIKMNTKDRKKLEDMIFSRKDWCLSRQRTWGVKIPDSNDILDVWFDSGTVFSMNDEPADLYIEGIDQFRGWFQTSTIIASMIDRLPTKRILAHGFVTNDLYEKYSKSSENYTPLETMYDLYNPDVLRLWVYLADYKHDVILSDDAIHSAAKQYFKIRNFMRYLLNNLHRTEHSHTNVSDVLKTKIHKLKDTLDLNVNDFDLNKAIRNIIQFINNYSSSLTEDIKNNFYESSIDDTDRINLENEFHYMLTELNGLIYPFVPFLSTEINIEL